MAAMLKFLSKAAGAARALTTSPQLVSAVYAPDLSPDLIPGLEVIRDDIVFAVRANAWIETHLDGPSSVRSRTVELPSWT